MIDPFAAIEALPRWMAWREEVRGSARALPTKVPYDPNVVGGSFGYASATDPATWGTHAQAGERARQLDDGRKTGCGTVLGDLGDSTYLSGADLDSSLDENRQLALWAAPIVDVLRTYGEVSPSGCGLKAFFRIAAADVRWFLDLIGVEPDAWGCKRAIPGLDGADHGPGIEIYTSARYFTVTGRIWSIDHPHIVTLGRDQLAALAELIPSPAGTGTAPIGIGSPGKPGKPGAPPRPSKGASDNSRSAKALRAALALAAADTYEEMCDGLREHPDPDITAWVEDKGEAHNERELKRLWDRFAVARAAARAEGLASLEARTGAPEDTEPDPDPATPPRRNGHDRETEEEGGGDLAEGLPTLDDGPEAGGEDAELTQEQIEERRAKIEAAMAETLTALNRHFAVVNEAGKCIVMKRTRDLAFDGRAMLERISFDDFTRMYLNRWIEVVVKKITKQGVEYDIVNRKLAPWWLEHPQRRQYLGGVTFDPTNRAPADFLNLWRGFAVAPQPGGWSLMKDHILKVICRGEPGDNKYVLDWLARLVQHPDEAGEVALGIRSTEKGTGKSILGRYLVRLFGRHGMHITHAAHLTGRFNAHLQDCCVLFADEAFFAGDKVHEGALKGLITEHTLTIEGKYRNAITVRNRLHVMIASNKDWVIPASVDERRFAMFEVLDTRRGDRAYFAAIVEQMDNGGLAAMLHELLHRDIRGFEVRDVPLTEALQVQKTLSLPSLERWWLAVLERGFLWKSRHGAPWFIDWHDFYSTELLVRSYLQWCDETRPYDRRTREQLGAFFKPLYPASRPRDEHPVFEIDSIDRQAVDVVTGQNGGVTTVPKSLDEIAIATKLRPHGYHVGEIEEARARFLELLPGIPSPWPEAPE